MAASGDLHVGDAQVERNLGGHHMRSSYSQEGASQVLQEELSKVPNIGPDYSLPKNKDLDSLLNGVQLTRESAKKQVTAYTVSEREASNVSRRLFEYYDRNRSGELEDTEIANMLKDLYKGISPDFVPTSVEVQGLRKVLDRDRDGKVTVEDLRLQTDRHLCVDNSFGVDGYYPFAKQSINFSQNPLMFDSEFGRPRPLDELTRASGLIHPVRDAEIGLSHARKVFERYDTDKNKVLEPQEILPILIDTFKMLNRDRLPTREDIELYLGMMDGNGDKRVSVEEFESFFLRAAHKRNITVPNPN